jgi:N-acetylglutamate synthase-like GNAT family acetyltransferase
MIREANKFDIDACVEMMRQYAAESPIIKLRDKKLHDEQHIRGLLSSLIIGRGFVLVDNEYRGMAAGIVVPNVWCPEVNEVRELAWWVAPEHRNTTIGGKLFLAYNKKAQELIDQERAEVVIISLMPQSPKIDLESRGFKKIDSTYCKE